MTTEKRRVDTFAECTNVSRGLQCSKSANHSGYCNFVLTPVVPTSVASSTETRCAECGGAKLLYWDDDSYGQPCGTCGGTGNAPAPSEPRAVSPAPGGEAPTVGTMIVRLALEERPDVDTPMWCQAVAAMGHIEAELASLRAIRDACAAVLDLFDQNVGVGWSDRTRAALAALRAALASAPASDQHSNREHEPQ